MIAVIRYVLVGVVASAVWPVFAGGAESVDYNVLVIRASKNGKKISPELKPLAEALKKAFKFTGYELIARREGSAGVDEAFTSGLTGPYSVRLTAMERKDGRIRMRVEVLERKEKKDRTRLKTDLSLRAERYQLFGGWKLQPDDVLIIAIGAK